LKFVNIIILASDNQKQLNTAKQNTIINKIYYIMSLDIT